MILQLISHFRFDRHWTEKRERIHTTIETVNSTAKEIVATVERNITDELYKITHKAP